MSNWEDIRKNLAKAKDTVVETADNISDLASVYLKVKEIKRKIRSELEDLGEYVYYNRGLQQTEEECKIYDKEIQASVDAIDGLRASLKEYEAKLEEAKNKTKANKKDPDNNE